jgi:energy-coupling factor transporter transmembrane protein EcfT
VSEGKLLRAWGAGCTRTILVLIVVFIAFVMIFVGLIILTAFLPIKDEQRIYLLMGGFLLFLFLMIAMVLVWGFWSIHRHARKLDEAINPLGLSGKQFLWNGRQYHGMLNGRQTDIYFYRGPSLDIYIASALHTRLRIGLKGRINQTAYGLMEKPEMVINDADLENFNIYSLDDRWGRELLDNPLAKAAILRLVAIQPGFEFRNLLFQPDAIHFHSHHINQGSLTPENMRAWMYDLLDLVRIAESLSTPEVIATVSSLEQRARLRRGDLTLPVIGITCGIIVFFSVIFIVVLVLLLSLGGGGN